MKRTLATTLVFVFCQFIWWLGGYDFDHRSPLVAYGLITSCFITGLVWIFPRWAKK